MNYKFEDSAVEDLAWFARYYDYIFPEGAITGYANFEKALNIILKSPEIGKIIPGAKLLRAHNIPGTHFRIYYFVKVKTIYISNVLDTRSIKTSKE